MDDEEQTFELCPVCARMRMPGAVACVCGKRFVERAATPDEAAMWLLPRPRSELSRKAQLVYVFYGLFWALSVFLALSRGLTFSALFRLPFVLYLLAFMAVELGAYIPRFRALVVITARLHLLYFAYSALSMLVLMPARIPFVLPGLLVSLVWLMIPLYVIRIYKMETWNLVEEAQADPLVGEIELRKPLQGPFIMGMSRDTAARLITAVYACYGLFFGHAALMRMAATGLTGRLLTMFDFQVLLACFLMIEVGVFVQPLRPVVRSIALLHLIGLLVGLPFFRFLANAGAVTTSHLLPPFVVVFAAVIEHLNTRKGAREALPEDQETHDG